MGINKINGFAKLLIYYLWLSIALNKGAYITSLYNRYEGRY
jgi:hypothetical protein